MKRTLIITIALTTLWSAGAAAQEPDTAMTAAELRLAACEARLDSLGQVSRLLKDSLDACARRITGIKDQAPLSPARHAALQEMMRDLDRFSSIGEVDAEIERCRRHRHEILQGLIEHSTRILETLLAKAAAASEPDQDLPARARELVEKRYGWELRLVAEYDRSRQSVPREGVTADSSDSPRTLMLKGDLLMDWRDRLAAEDSIAAGRIVTLGKELALRTRVAEVSQDLSLFNEHEERLTRGGDPFTRGENTAEMFDSKNGLEEGRILPGYPDDYLFQENLLGSPLPSTIPGIQARIRQLEQYRRLLAAGADSLRIRADWFYRKAGETGRR
ncbi:hypothetical protein JXO52_07230 [bacterium]|nr:hypothetical protein [bacterium]